MGWLLEYEVGVGAGDAEGGHRRAAGAAGVWPGAGIGEQGDLAGVPVDVRGGGVHVQGAGELPVLHGGHHLDDAGGACGGLGVADVGFD